MEILSFLFRSAKASRYIL